MAEVSRVAETATDEDKSAEYDAFLSYAHRDRQVTVAIQKGLHQIGRPLGRLRALRVFRDDTNLTASPDLWGKITEALDHARYMIVVLSPQSAASHWVNEEINYWLSHRGHEHLMLVLGEGRLQWDATNGRFDPERSDAAPPALTEPGSLRSEPLYIDVSHDAPWDVRSLTFRDKVTALAAPIHGKPKDQLAGDDLREQRRSRRLRAAAISGLVVLTVVAVVAALIAVAKQQEANRRLRDAVVAKLNAEGPAMLAGTTPGNDVRALQELLAANAVQANGVPILNAQIARFTTQKIIDTPSNVFGVAYSPDGRRIVTGQTNGTVRQWDSASGEPIGAPLKGHSDRAKAVTYTPDGHIIASAGPDGTMRLFDADTGAAINSHPQRVEGLYAIAVSPDGKVIFTGGDNGTLQLWDPHSGQLRTTIKVFNDSNSSINDVAVNREGNLLAVSSEKGEITLYNTKTLQQLGPTIEIQRPDGSRTGVFGIAFSPDGHTLAVATEDVQLWDVSSGTLVRRIQLGTKTFGTWAMAVAFSPDGLRLATGSQDGAVQLWDPGTGAQLGQTMSGHAGMVQGVAFSGDGRQIATTSVDRTLRLWSVTVGQLMRGAEEHLFQAAFSPDGQLVGALGDTAIEQWDVRTGQPLPPLTLTAGTFTYLDGHRIVVAADDSTARVLDAKTGQPVQPPVHLDLPADSASFAFSDDGRMFASGSHDGTVRLWDVATGKPLGKPMLAEAPDKTVEGLAFTGDGRHLVVGYDEGIGLWNTDTSQREGPVIRDRADPTKPIMSIAVSRDGETLAAGGLDGIRLWDRRTGNQLSHSPIRGPNGLIFTLAFGVGHQLASGGVDATLRLWDTATGEPTAAPQPQSEAVLSATISPDGRLAASANADGSLLLSPAVADPAQLCKKLPNNMSHKQWRDWVSPGIEYITLCPELPIAPD
jgi:WD40 repeat protein